MKKTGIVLIVGLVFIAFGFVYWYDLKTNPTDFAQSTDIGQTYLEFRDGGDISYTSKFQDTYLKITDQKELSFIKNEISKLDFDWKASHRPSDFSVYLNFDSYREGKWEIKMSRINDEIVFFMGRGLYRNDSLANYIIEKLKIDRK
ncbi:MAG: hypothetical protein ABJ092_14615 [Gillisia sp.]